MPRDPRLPDLEATVNGRLLSRGIRHATFLERLKTHHGNGVLGVLNRDVLPDVVDRLRSRLDRIRSRGFDRGPWTTQRYKDMIAGVGSQITEGLDDAYQSLRHDLRELGITEAEWQVARLRQEAGPFGVEFRLPPKPLLRSIVDKRPIEGLTLGGWFKDIAKRTKQAIAKEVSIGLAEGETVEQMIRRVRGTQARGFTDGVFQTTRREAQALVRTSVAHTSAQAREITYDENAELITGVTWVSTLDHRTCPVCAGLDAETFQPKEGPRPPAHPNCRCTTVPQLKSWKALGIPLNEAPVGTRASMSGQVAGSTDFPGWLRGQGADVQNEVLGKGRAQLWRAGKVDIDAFRDERNRPLSLRDIRKLEGLGEDG